MIGFSQPAAETTLLDYVHEVDHMAGRIQRLEQALPAATPKLPPEMREIVRDLRALRGVTLITARGS